MEKIGQLFMLPVSAYYQKDELERLKKAVHERHVGGIILYKASSKKHLSVLRSFQKIAATPLLVALDAEWGAAMRITDAIPLPRNMTLGAVQDDSLIRRAGKEAGRQLRALGVTVDFAPVVDVNNNPKNPVINDRSFGENPENVASKGLAFAQGLQESGIIATAKHFPGHGDTTSDSHETLPRMTHDLERLHSLELLPFERLIDGGVDAIMTAHLQGLIFTDALQMKAVLNHFKPGDESLEAALAGNDILLLGSIDNNTDPVLEKHLPEGIRKIWLAVEDGRLPKEELDKRVLKILRMKETLGLHEDPRPGADDPKAMITHPKMTELRKEILDAAVTLVKNKDSTLPLKGAVGKVAYVEAGAKPGKVSKLLSLTGPLTNSLTGGSPFQRTLAKRLNLKSYRLAKDASDKRVGKILRKIDDYDTLIVGVFGMRRWSSKGFGITRATRDLLQRADAKGKRVVLVLFGNPYALQYFGEESAILCAYEDSQEAQNAAARIIIGDLAPQGKLPITASESFKAGIGLTFD
jgi:beta-glucosidase-like glycosyl hydrolase